LININNLRNILVSKTTTKNIIKNWVLVVNLKAIQSKQKVVVHGKTEIIHSRFIIEVLRDNQKFKG